MAFLHTHCISGPIQSRRLGVSLGVNLLPTGRKICNYNCAYCECGLNQTQAVGGVGTATDSGAGVGTRAAVGNDTGAGGVRTASGSRVGSGAWNGSNGAAVETAGMAKTAEELIAMAQAQGELPTPDEIEAALDRRLRKLKSEGRRLDSLTFSGNGEPTLHPQFEEIMQRVADVRRRLSPHTPITVLSNAALLHKEDIRRAIGMADKRILKLDAATQALYTLINAPNQGSNSRPDQDLTHNQGPSQARNMTSLEALMENLRSLPYPFTIQTLLLRGKVSGRANGGEADGPVGDQVGSRANGQTDGPIGGTPIDNTTGEALEAYLNALRTIQPSDVVLYGLDRDTPEKDLQKLSKEELREVALLLRSAGAPPVQYHY